MYTQLGPTGAQGVTGTTNSNATAISVTDNNTNATFYPTFVTGSGSSQTMFADITTTPLTYIPSTGTLSASTLSATTALSGLLQTFLGQTSFKILFGETGGGTSSGTVTYSDLSPTTTFTNTPFVFLTAVRDDNATHCAYVRTISNTAFTWNCRDETGSLINANIQFLLIGI